MFDLPLYFTRATMGCLRLQVKGHWLITCDLTLLTRSLASAFLPTW